MQVFEDTIQLHCPSGEIQLMALFETAQNKASRILTIILGYCAEQQSSGTLSNFG